jgi:hypothetical protein
VRRIDNRFRLQLWIGTFEQSDYVTSETFCFLQLHRDRSGLLELDGPEVSAFGFGERFVSRES